MNEQATYSVLTSLPNNGQKCLCFGHKTFCCKEDMDEEAKWHEVIFSFDISSYKLKKQFPEDLEESILQKYTMIEHWKSIDEELPRDHIIGVTKWMLLPDPPKE